MDPLAFIHVPKTGGTTVQHILRKARLAGSRPHQHRQIDAQDIVTGRSFAVLREPCAWYRSALHYSVGAAGETSPWMAQFLTNGKLELDAAVHKLVTADLPMRYFNWLGGSRCDTKACRRHGIGPYTWLVLCQLQTQHIRAHRLPASLEVHHLLDTAQLRAGLKELLGSWGHDITTTLETVDDVNTNAERALNRLCSPYAGSLETTLSPSTIDRIYRRDRFIVDLMGYTGPGSSAARVVTSL